MSLRFYVFLLVTLFTPILVAQDKRPPLNQPIEPLTFAGRVVDIDGNPVGGSQIYVAGTKNGIELVERIKTDATGQFRFTIKPEECELSHTFLQRQPWGRGIYIGATAEGHGATTIGQIPADQREKLEIRLPTEAVAQGRIVDSAGQPVEGVRVGVSLLAGNLDENGIPTTAKDQKNRLLKPVQFAPYVKSRHQSISDVEGRVNLRGLSNEWLYRLHISSPTIVSQEHRLSARVQVAEVVGPNHPGITKMWNYGLTFSIEVSPCKPVTGVVRESGTGKPIANVTLRRKHDDSTLSNPVIQTKTDDRGKFTLTGLAHGKHQFRIDPPKHAPYVSTEIPLEIYQAGFDPMTFDIDLQRQPMVSGRLIDSVTGQPVRGSVHYRPMNSNKNLAEYPNLTTKRPLNMGLVSVVEGDGLFSFAVPSGPGVILARGNEEYTPCRLAPEHRVNGIAVAADPELIDCLPCAAWPGEFSAYVLVDVSKEKTEDLTIKLRKGKSRSLVVEFPEGKTSNTSYLGGKSNDRHGNMYYQGQSVIAGLDESEERRVYISTFDNQFTWSQVVRGKDEGPVVAKLVPSGTITGRALDQDGRPLANATFKLTYQDHLGVPRLFLRGGLMRQDWVEKDALRHRLTGTLVDSQLAFGGTGEKSDDEGRFRLPGIFPDIPFEITIIAPVPAELNLQSSHGVAKLGIGKVKSGETVDLGDLRIKEKLVSISDELRKRGGD